MTFRGIVRGKVIRLKGRALIPEGTEVEVVVKEPKPVSASGSPQAVLAAVDRLRPGLSDDVDALIRAINDGRRPVRFNGPFDVEGTHA